MASLFTNPNSTLKLTISKSALLSVAQQCAAVALQKAPNPVFSCVLLRADKNGLTGYATDLDHEIAANVSARVDDDGDGLAGVNARDLLDRAKTLPEGEIDVYLDGEKLTIKAGKRRHSIGTIPADQFPQFSAMPVERVTVAADVLSDVLKRTKYAASPDPSRTNMYGVFLELLDGQVQATATDSKAVARLTLACETSKRRPGILLPKVSTDTLVGLLKSGNAEIAVATDRCWFSVGADKSGDGKTIYCTKISAGDFPPVDQVLAMTPHPNVAPVSVAELRAAVDSVEKASPDGTTHGFVSMTFRAGEIHVEACGKGDAEDTVPCGYEGSEVKIGMYAIYVLTALGAVKSETARVSFGGDLDPVWVQNAEGDDLVQLIMPARL